MVIQAGAPGLVQFETCEVRRSGVERTNAQGQYVSAAWNLLRMAKLWLAPPERVRA